MIGGGEGIVLDESGTGKFMIIYGKLHFHISIIERNTKMNNV